MIDTMFSIIFHYEIKKKTIWIVYKNTLSWPCVNLESKDFTKNNLIFFDKLRQTLLNVDQKNILAINNY